MWRAKRLVQRLQIPDLKLQLRGLCIQVHVFGPNRLGDGNHAILSQNPCQRYLRRGRRVTGGHLGQRRVGQQLPALAYWTVCHQWLAMLLARWQQVKFDAAFLQVVQHLVGGARRGVECLHVIHVEIGHAPGADPAVFAQTFEGLDGSVKGKAGKTYAHWSAFTLETQHYPDAPNQPGFPSTRLDPGKTYTQNTVFRFSAQ